MITSKVASVLPALVYQVELVWRIEGAPNFGKENRRCNKLWEKHTRKKAKRVGFDVLSPVLIFGDEATCLCLEPAFVGGVSETRRG
ncbi:MAG: hypothetical protein VX438_17270 [Planctomycetota bacterium]|nr:hypothetical protein [Planctomycetota bacterium]